MSHVTCYLARVVAVAATAIAGTVYLYLATMTIFSQVEPSKRWSMTAATAVLGGIIVVALTWSVGLLLQSCGPIQAHAIHHYPPIPGGQPPAHTVAPGQLHRPDLTNPRMAGSGEGIRLVPNQADTTAPNGGGSNTKPDPLGEVRGGSPLHRDRKGGDTC